MTATPRLLRLLLAGAVALALSAPATGLAAEEDAKTTGKTETSAPTETTGTTPALEVPAAIPTSPATDATPAPAAPSPPQATTTPQVSAQRPQGSTPGSSRAHAKPNGAGGRGNGARTGGSPATPRRGKRAPKPSTLTPPLPLSLSGSIAGIPGFFIESFRIPPFLLPIYQAAGTAYGVPWQVLAAINEVETDYGRDLSVSSANAEGWMQFLPSSWATYGVDANGDGFKDPYNPADAIFAAARYLRAAGAATNVRAAVFAYNHSQAYVESVMLRAKLLGGTPSELLGAITGLTEARFPVHAQSHFSDGFPALPSDGSGAPKTIAGTTIYSEPGAPVIAVQDGQVVQIGDSPELGRFISLRDAYGNTYTYAKLGSVATLYPVLKPHAGAATQAPSPKAEPAEPRPTGPASAGTQTDGAAQADAASEGAAVSSLALGGSAGLASAAPAPATGSAPATGTPPVLAPASPEVSAPSEPSTSDSTPASPGTTPRVFRAGPNDVYLHPLHAGARVIAGTVLGHVEDGASGAGAGLGASADPHMLFQIRPAGVGAPLIDPKPILDGWVQLENSSVFRARGQNPFLATAPTAGQVLLESKEQLEQQVLKDADITIYPCGRQDIQAGQIDRRVLAALEFLAVSGLKPTVSALKCGHSELTAEGNISEHSTGDAVDISEINGTPIVGHQGAGSIADTTIRKLLTLQGSMKPHQIISLMSYPGTDNTLAKSDHYNHIHVGFRPLFAEGARLSGALSSSITPSQWIKLIARLGEIPDPTVASGPSAAAIPVHPNTAAQSEGEHGGND
jgi:murein DD-endopeptidase MepM/ murein hydrolase activator NlpD